MYIGLYKTLNKALSKHCLYDSTPLPPGLVHTMAVASVKPYFNNYTYIPLKIITKLRNISLSSPEKKKKKEETKSRKDRILSWSKHIQLSLWAPPCSGAPSRSSDDKF